MEKSGHYEVKIKVHLKYDVHHVAIPNLCEKVSQKEEVHIFKKKFKNLPSNSNYRKTFLYTSKILIQIIFFENAYHNDYN